MDGAILVVSAGGRPRCRKTREHILAGRARWGVPYIVVYLNKAGHGGTDAELLELVELEVRDLLKRVTNFPGDKTADHHRLGAEGGWRGDGSEIGVPSVAAAGQGAG